MLSGLYMYVHVRAYFMDLVLSLMYDAKNDSVAEGT